MNIFFRPPNRNCFVESNYIEALSKLKSIGINTLYLVPFYFTPSPQSDSIFPTQETISDSDLTKAINLSKQYGINAVLKPQIDCLNSQPRYKIKPLNYSRWILSYKKFIIHYLQIAKNNKLSSFVIATELDNVVEKQEFLSLCDSIRLNSEIKIIYAASFNQFVNTHLWNHTDIMGVDAYFNLDNSDSPLKPTLYETWNFWLNTLSQQSSIYKKPIIITEVGYMSRKNAAQNPGDYSGNPPPSVDVQKYCYESLLSQACKFDNIKGIIFWQWELDKASNNDYTPRDKPAEDIIRKYWL